MAKAAQKEIPELNINLLPSAGPSGTLGTAIGWTLTIGRYLIILTEIIAISIFILNIKFSTDKQSLKENIQSLSREVSAQSEFEGEFRFVQQRINEIKTQRDAHFPENLVITEFLKLLPQGMKIDSLEIKDDEVTFSGSFPTPDQLQTLVSSFAKSDQNKFIGLDIAELNSPSEKNPLYTFKAQVRLVPSNFKK